MDEEKKAMSGPKARKATMFQRAVLNSRRREQPVRRDPDGAFEDRQSDSPDTGVRAQQKKLKAAFGDSDAA